MYKFISEDSRSIVHIPTSRCIYLDQPPTVHTEAYLQWVAEGGVAVAYVAPPIIPEIVNQQTIVQAMEQLFDQTAQAKHYDNRVTCALRAGYVGPFQAEGIAFAQWMDSQNAKGYAMLAQVQAGTMPMPSTTAEALALLDPMVWPST